MFDISWTEFLLIGIVALVVIGPKELPGVMRTIGQYTRKIRGMAADFQGQFQEAMREAEMADLKKQVDDMASDIKNYDPLKTVRDDIETAGKDIEKSFAADTASGPAADKPSLDAALTPEALPPPASDAAAPVTDVTGPEPFPVVAEPVNPEPAAAETAAADPVAAEPAGGEPASTERNG